MSINNNKQLNYLNNYYLNDTNSTLSSNCSSSSLSTSSSSSSLLLLTPNNQKERQQQTVENDLFENDEEFQSILKQYKNNDKNINVTTLKYLYKLLKFFKLDHYMIDLIENGYTTPIQLNNLNIDDEFESIVNLSPYDKKKFFKLKIFIKQIIKSIQLKSKSSNNNNILNDKLNDYLVNNDDYENFVDPSLNNVKDNNKYIKNYSNTINNNNNNKNINMLKKDLVILNQNTTANNNNNKKHQQMFMKNPNINHSRAKRIVIPPHSARSTTTNSAKFNSNGPYTSRSTTNTNYSVYKSNSNKQPRAKSTEPLSLNNNNNNNNKLTGSSTKSITNLDQLATSDLKLSVAAVQHPSKYSKLINNNNTNTNKFFGPKLQQFKENQKNISNVKLIETNNYNYGVPLQQQQQQQMKYSSNGRKNNNHFYNKKYYFNLVNQQTSKSKLVTNDIYVYARKRPMLQSESNFSDVVVIGNESNSSINNDHTNEISQYICINELKSSVDGTPVLRKNEFTFDRTFDSTYTNENIFKSSILPFIESNYTKSNNRNDDFSCICFGQTGSGKTHTLFGTKQQDGLCVLTAQSLLYANKNINNSNEFRIMCGFFEIYNGQLFDLINQNNRLVLREDSNGQLNVVGLVEVEIKSLNDLRKIIEKSQLNRHIGTTSFNKASSRSHAVVQFKIITNHSNSNDDNSSDNRTINSANKKFSTVKSKINTGLNKSESNSFNRSFRILFVDLAGSERGIDAQNNTQDNRKEGAEINQSLLALKECIRCIDQYCAHAPFRQSKLTRVLRDCFIGCGKTILIATVSPTDDCVSCSLNTLQYANRVRQMTLRNRPNNQLNCVPENIQSKNQPISSSSSSNINKTNKINTKNNFIVSTNNIKKALFPAPTTTSINNKKITVKEDSNPAKITNEMILPSKPSSSKSVPSSSNQTNINNIFHPSKINMSSTPIKTLLKPCSTDTVTTSNVEFISNHSSKNKNDVLIFDNDTPIKGHKLKYMPADSNNKIAQLAERYFSRVNMEEKNIDLNEKIAPKSAKNEDEESGVESDEKSKKNIDKNDNNSNIKGQQSSLANKVKISDKYIQRYRSIYSLDSPPPQTPTIESTEQQQITQPTQEMNNQKNLVKSSSNSSLLLLDENLNKLRQKQRELLESKKIVNQTTPIDSQVNNETKEDPSEAIINLQNNRQLRNYIQTLENKLNNLRNEMNNDQSNINNNTTPTASINNNKNNNNKFESIKKRERAYSTESTNSTDSAKEIMETTSKLSINSRKMIDNDNNDIEKLFMQKSIASYTLYSDEEDEYKRDEDDNDILKKSLHHSSSDTLFSKFKNTKKPIINQFSPIEILNKNHNSNSSKIAQQLINPIPIRISSSSSSFDSTHNNNNNNKTLECDLNENTLSSESKIKLTNSGRIWKSTKTIPNQTEPQLTKRNTWSSILTRSQNCLEDNKNEAKDVNKNGLKHKDSVVNAHEHQLTDLAETYKKEVNLLSCLKESQVGFDEYLNQVEEILTKKAHSIRDLQLQINQLKTNKNGIIKNNNESGLNLNAILSSINQAK